MSEAAGYNIPMSRIPFSRYCYVGDSEAQVRRDTRPSLEWTIDMIQWRGTFKAGTPVRVDNWSE
jgi:hypothetical protein